MQHIRKIQQLQSMKVLKGQYFNITISYFNFIIIIGSILLVKCNNVKKTNESADFKNGNYKYSVDPTINSYLESKNLKGISIGPNMVNGIKVDSNNVKNSTKSVMRNASI